MAGCYKCDDGAFHYRKCGEFSEWPNISLLLKKNFYYPYIRHIYIYIGFFMF